MQKKLTVPITTLALTFIAAVSLAISNLGVQKAVHELNNAWYGERQLPGGRADYVLGVALNIQSDRLSIFVQSWRRFSPQTKLALFVSSAELHGRYERPELAVLFEECNVEAIPFDLPKGLAVHVYRFELYRRFLEANQDRIRGVIITDVTDVIVQSDPWAHPELQQALAGSGVLFSLQGGPSRGGVAIKDQYSNMNCVQQCFGEEVAASIGEETISCSGVTMGAAGAVLAYVERMQEVISKEASEGCLAIRGADQGVHNYLLHVLGPKGGLGFPYRAVPNMNSPVYTLSLGFPVELDRFKRLRTVEGVLPPIVHQFNRHPDLRGAYTGLYPLDNSTQGTVQVTDAR